MHLYWISVSQNMQAFGDDKMNEKIFDLAKQANLIEWHPIAGTDAKTPDHMSIARAEKFAELIVQECAQVCLEQRNPGNLNYKPSEKFAEAIKQHFGVK